MWQAAQNNQRSNLIATNENSNITITDQKAMHETGIKIQAIIASE